MVKRELKPIRVQLTGGNLKQLQKGNATLLKHAQLDEKNGTVTLWLKPRTFNKLHKAFVKEKGVKIQMTPVEYHHSFVGTGSTKNFFRQVGKAAIQEGIPAAAAGAAAAGATVAGAPEFAPIAGLAASAATRPLGKMAAEKALGKGLHTGGAMTHMGGVGDVEILRKAPSLHGLNFVDPTSPAWFPAPGLRDTSDSRPVRGGSFLPAGAYSTGGSIHPAMVPKVGHSDLRNKRL